MRKKIKKDGNSHKIRINSEDMDLYNLQEGDVIEFTIIKLDPKEENDY